jgi:hypothetical protein
VHGNQRHAPRRSGLEGEPDRRVAHRRIIDPDNDRLRTERIPVLATHDDHRRRRLRRQRDGDRPDEQATQPTQAPAADHQQLRDTGLLTEGPDGRADHDRAAHGTPRHRPLGRDDSVAHVPLGPGLQLAAVVLGQRARDHVPGPRERRHQAQRRTAAVRLDRTPARGRQCAVGPVDPDHDGSAGGCGHLVLLGP